MAAHKIGLDEAFEKIEESILPSISATLDMLLDAASLSRAGVNADVYAGELRRVAAQLETLTRQMESISPVGIGARAYGIVSAA